MCGLMLDESGDIGHATASYSEVKALAAGNLLLAVLTGPGCLRCHVPPAPGAARIGGQDQSVSGVPAISCSGAWRR